MNIKIALSLSIAAIALVGCDDTTAQTTGAQRETAATRQLLDQASTAVGMPAVRNFTEKRNLKMLYELRDNADLVTYSYYLDFYGKPHKVCPTTSVGFGIPFSAQFTAPSVDTTRSGHQALTTITTYQPEPNGLYMPDATSATWVMCLGSDGNIKPVYVEPQIIVTLEPMTD